MIRLISLILILTICSVAFGEKPSMVQNIELRKELKEQPKDKLECQLPRPSSTAGGTINSERNPHRDWVWETDKEPHNSGWALYIDNDLFALQSSDKDYTGGLSVTLAGRRAKEYAISLNPWLERMNQTLGIDKLHNTDNRELNSLEFGFTVFTPSNLSRRNAQPDDRPYAGLLFLSNTKENLDFKKDSALISTFTLGIIGAPLINQIQTQLHKALGSEAPVGWNNQISNGGELTFRYSVAKQDLFLFDYDPSGGIEVSTTAQASVGYLSELSWGIGGRVGQFNSPWYSFRPQFNDYSEKSTSLAGLGKTAEELYFFGGANVHLRGYNSFLQGQFRDSNVTFSSKEIRQLVADIWLGVAKQFKTGWRVNYLLRAQTSEVKTGSADRSVIWGGLILSKSV